MMWCCFSGGERDAFCGGGLGCISAEIDYGVSENMNDIAGLTEYIVRAKRTDEH